jgi:hypothetical protein
MARLHDIVVDCRHPASLARFWAAVLEGYAVAPYDDEELARLRAAGIDDPEDDPTVLVESPAGVPRLWFQRVPEAKVAKNRVHLDVRCDDFDDEISRLLELGATVTAFEPSGPGHAVLADPEGNEFCVFAERLDSA